MIGHRVTFLFSQPLFQAAYDLAGASQCEGNCVPEDFASCHGSIEHKENERAPLHFVYGSTRSAKSVMQTPRQSPE